MNSKTLKIIGLSLLPIFLLMLDIFGLYSYICQNLVVIYILYVFIVKLLEDLKVLNYEENTLIDKVIFAQTDDLIIFSLLLFPLMNTKLLLTIYIILFLIEILKIGKIALLLNKGVDTEIKFEKLTIYVGYIALILIYLIPSYYYITSIFILPYLVLKAISTYELFK